MKTIEQLLQQAESDPNHSSISFAEKSFNSKEQAEKAFADYKIKLMKIDVWNRAGNLAEFELFNLHGEIATDGKLAENLLLRLSLKGAGKYDWVKIVEIKNYERELILTVQPSFDPTDEILDKDKMSHFFTDEARNNFCLQLDTKKVNFYIIGLNEKQNTTQTQSLLETVRNVAAANFGSYFGIQKAEWTIFAGKFLEL
jgi:hypothetical protein